MKLKYKLFLSYVLIIVIFSFVLVFLLLEVKFIATSLNQHTQNDILSNIYLAKQLQLLEELNANYIILFIPINHSEKIVRLEQSRQKFDASWIKIKMQLEKNSDTYSGNLFHNSFLKILNANIDRTKSILPFEKKVDTKWRELNNHIRQSIKWIQKNDFQQARYLRETYVLPEFKSLRKQLLQLNQLLGKQSIDQTRNLSHLVQKTQSGILILELVLLIFSILIALLVARKITQPIETLKNAVQRMAIQNYTITIPKKPNDEVGELSSAFEELSLHLKEADRFKSAILSQFTHEMKSPLGSIKQATLLLENSLEEVTPTQKRFLEIIKGNYQTLIGLISNILQSASYDLGQIQLKYSSANLVQIITEVLINLSPIIKEKNLKVDIHFSAKRIEAQVDVPKFKEVVQNLLSNAIKFSHSGKRIAVKLNEKLNLIRFTVVDQGIGIPQKEIPYIFEKMYRASNSEKISVKGTGLGLYIAAQIVRAHGGQIKVNSSLNKGSSFTIILPKNRRIAEEGGWLDA